MSKFDELTEAKKAYYELIQEKGKTLVQEWFKEVLEKHPNIVALRWDQYTPYFNDGETCYFGVHELQVKTVDSKEDDTDWSDFGEGFDYAPEDVASEFGSIPEDVLEHAFGDHVQITVTREGIQIDTYDHD